jgi:hypothetical protein
MTYLNKSAQAYNLAAANALKVPIPFLNGDQQGEFIFSGEPDYPNLSSFVTIRNQGQEGSPTSVAIVTAMETCLNMQGRPEQLSARGTCGKNPGNERSSLLEMLASGSCRSSLSPSISELRQKRCGPIRPVKPSSPKV